MASLLTLSLRRHLTLRTRAYVLWSQQVLNLGKPNNQCPPPLERACSRLSDDVYCKTGNFRVRLIFAKFVIVIKTRKLIFVNMFAYHYNI